MKFRRNRKTYEMLVSKLKTMMVIEISIITPCTLHAFIKYMRHLVMKNHLLSFSFAMDDMDEIFLRVLDSI